MASICQQPPPSPVPGNSCIAAKRPARVLPSVPRSAGTGARAPAGSSPACCRCPLASAGFEPMQGALAARCRAPFGVLRAENGFKGSTSIRGGQGRCEPDHTCFRPRGRMPASAPCAGSWLHGPPGCLGLKAASPLLSPSHTTQLPGSIADRRCRHFRSAPLRALTL